MSLIAFLTVVTSRIRPRHSRPPTRSPQPRTGPPPANRSSPRDSPLKAFPLGPRPHARPAHSPAGREAPELLERRGCGEGEGDREVAAESHGGPAGEAQAAGEVRSESSEGREASDGRRGDAGVRYEDLGEGGRGRAEGSG